MTRFPLLTALTASGTFFFVSFIILAACLLSMVELRTPEEAPTAEDTAEKPPRVVKREESVPRRSRRSRSATVPRRRSRSVSTVCSPQLTVLLSFILVARCQVRGIPDRRGQDRRDRHHDTTSFLFDRVSLA